MNNILPLVALVGAPNVGKSSLFNRLIRQNKAITDDQPGVTRDRLYGKCEWLDRTFMVIDTGGITLDNAPLQKQIRMQAEIAIEEADVIIFVVDGKIGLNDDDTNVAKILRKSGKPVVLVVNKIDDVHLISASAEFYRLGLGDPLAISSIHGINIGDMLDVVVKKLPKVEEAENEEVVSFSVIGRPNVGKSSLVNAILKSERVIVSSIPGTTRDAIDTDFTYDMVHYRIIDTAGLNRRGKIYEALDKYSALRSIRAIERSDVCLLVCDLETGIQEQDKHVLQLALESYKGIVIVVNKYDTVSDKETNTMSNLEKNIRKQFQFVDYAPMVFVSALTRSRCEKVFPLIQEAYTNYARHVSTNLLNSVMQDLQLLNPPPDFNGGRIRINYVNQSGVKPPTFVLFCNNPSFMHFSYQRYIENRLRETFSLEGTPLKIVLRRKN